MERLSILVPLTGDLTRFEDTLVSVLENRPERSSVVVVTTRHYDDPYNLRGEVEFVDARPGAGLLESLSAGLAASRAPVVHLLGAGVEATAGWADVALARFAESDVAAVAPLMVDRERPQTILSAGLRYASSGAIRRLAAGMPLGSFVPNERRFCAPELISAFYRREAVEAIDSLVDDGSPAAAAIELGLALRRAGYRSVQEPRAVMLANADVLAPQSAWREGFADERLYRRHHSAADSRLSSLAHAASVAAEAAQVPIRPSMLARLAGRLGARVAPRAAADVVLGESTRQQIAGSIVRPLRYVASESRGVTLECDGLLSLATARRPHPRESTCRPGRW